MKPYTYEDYYELCKQNYAANSEPLDPKLNLYDLKMQVIRPGAHHDLIQTPDNYLSLVESLSEKINNKVLEPSEHYKDPSASGYDIAVQIREVWDIPELEQIAEAILPQLEKNVFNSYIHLSAIHAYRNVQTDSPEVSSWLWHYDNNPKEAVKLLIYLTDVNENNAPFETLEKDGDYIKMLTSRTGYNNWGAPYVPQSRIPKNMMNEFSATGYKRHKITGPAGTLLFFDNNIVHRATIPTEGHRDVAILNIRPTFNKIRPWISKSTCGSWMHKSPIMDPNATTPKLK